MSIKFNSELTGSPSKKDVCGWAPKVIAYFFFAFHKKACHFFQRGKFLCTNSFIGIEHLYPHKKCIASLGKLNNGIRNIFNYRFDIHEADSIPILTFFFFFFKYGLIKISHSLDELKHNLRGKGSVLKLETMYPRAQRKPGHCSPLKISWACQISCPTQCFLSSGPDLWPWIFDRNFVSRLRVSHSSLYLQGSLHIVNSL